MFQSRNRESSYFNYTPFYGKMLFFLFQSRNRESSYFNSFEVPPNTTLGYRFNLVIENLLISTNSAEDGTESSRFQFQSRNRESSYFNLSRSNLETQDFSLGFNLVIENLLISTGRW